ncbi:TNT domain-containing protein [Streptomyces sp. NPDC050485]|uniref:TNT domain-containing protein n=1 Tax=Streptomyces sp. NPDC050485 TaxID=3365617 RepID=UPI00378F6DE4
MALSLGSGVATAAADGPAAIRERPATTPPQVHGAPAQVHGAPGAGLSASANRPPNTPKGPEVGPPFKQTAGIWQTDTTAPTLRNTVVDPDGDKTTSTFEVWNADKNGNAASKVNLTDANKWGVLVSGYTASGTPTNVNVPAGKLKDGQTYLVRSSAYDGSAYETDWSPWSKFTVGVPVVPPVPPTGDPHDEVPADVKAKWQALAKDALAAYDREQAELADIRDHSIDAGAAAVKQLNLNTVVLPDNGYVGIPHQFMAARVYDSRATDNPTVSLVGGCDGALHCTQKFRLDYTLRVDTFYCVTPGAPANIGTKCNEGDVRWTGFSAEAQTEEFTRTYNRITDGWDKFMGQMLGDLPKTFMACVSGDTGGQPPVIARKTQAAPRVTSDQCAETGMQLGALIPLAELGGAAKVTSDPLVEINYTAEQVAKAKGSLNALKLAEGGSNKYASALKEVIDRAVRADKTGGLSLTFKKLADLPEITKNMPPEAQKLMGGYKPFGNRTMEEWFHQFWNTEDGWYRYPYFDGFQGTPTNYFPKAGELMDRFGGTGYIDEKGAAKGGGFLAPKDGTPYSQRALPPDNVVAEVTDRGGYHVYKWIKPWTAADAAAHGNIQGGKIAPWFDQPGGGTQYLLPKGTNVFWLLKYKYIEEVK